MWPHCVYVLTKCIRMELLTCKTVFDRPEVEEKKSMNNWSTYWIIGRSTKTNGKSVEFFMCAQQHMMTISKSARIRKRRKKKKHSLAMNPAYVYHSRLDTKFTIGNHLFYILDRFFNGEAIRKSPPHADDVYECERYLVWTFKVATGCGIIGVPSYLNKYYAWERNLIRYSTLHKSTITFIFLLESVDCDVVIMDESHGSNAMQLTNAHCEYKFSIKFKYDDFLLHSSTYTS